MYNQGLNCKVYTEGFDKFLRTQTKYLMYLKLAYMLKYSVCTRSLAM